VDKDERARGSVRRGVGLDVYHADAPERFVAIGRGEIEGATIQFDIQWHR
jgi:hypothetical protein